MSANLDMLATGGNITQDSPGATLWWTGDLNDLRGADWPDKLVVPDQSVEATPDACTAAATHHDLPTLKAGVRFCTRTKAGALATATVKSVTKDGPLVLQVSVW